MQINLSNLISQRDVVQLAKARGVPLSIKTLEGHRYRDAPTGCQFLRIGDRVWFEIEAVERWLDQRSAAIVSK